MLSNMTIEVGAMLAKERRETLLKESQRWLLLKESNKNSLPQKHQSRWAQFARGATWLQQLQGMAHGWLPAKPSNRHIAAANCGD